MNRFFKVNECEFCFFKVNEFEFLKFSKSMIMNVLIRHLTNLNFFDLKYTKQKQQFVRGLCQHILQTFHKIYHAN